MTKANLKRRIAAALPFAHLLGISAAKAEDDELKQGADESDEDYAKRMEEEDKKQGADESDDDYAKRMEEEDKKQGDDESDEDYASRMEDDDNEAGDDEGGESKKEKAARISERARCEAIFASPAAGVRPDMAAHLAFSTDMSKAEAIAMLSAFAKGSTPKNSLSSRMARVQTPNPGVATPAAAAVTGPAAVAQRILAAGKKARGEK
jgi:hypothetical protein